MKAKPVASAEPLETELDARLLDPTFEYPDIFDEPEDEAEDIRRDEAAEADYAAGRFVSNERVIEWLRSLGGPNPLPTPYFVAEVVWTDAAVGEVDAITAYVAKRAPLAALRLNGRLVSATIILRDFPLSGRAISRGRRELTVVRPYLIRYRIVGDQVTITEVRHGARRPSD